jgi:hypothetical protein
MLKGKSGINVQVSANIERKLSAVEEALISSNWEWEHWRDGVKIDEWVDHNICVNEGLDHVLGVAFSQVTQITQWFVLLYNTDTTPAAGMTYASPLFTESTHYTEANRPQWQEGGVSSRVITNSANKASFTMSTAETIYGAGIVSVTTKGDKAGGGVLFNVADFSGGSKTVASSDVLKVTIQLTISNV